MVSHRPNRIGSRAVYYIHGPYTEVHLAGGFVFIKFRSKIHMTSIIKSAIFIGEGTPYAVTYATKKKSSEALDLDMYLSRQTDPLSKTFSDPFPANQK